jgi:hypothetical protein
MVRSLRTTTGFFHQRIAEDAETPQERCALVLRERRQRALERLVSVLQPGAHALRRQCVQVDHRPPPVVGVLAPADELVVLEVARELARRGQAQAELRGDLADRPLALRRDVREHGDVPRSEGRVAADEREELRRRMPASPQAAEDPPQRDPQLCYLFGNSYHRITVTSLAERR